MKRALIIIVLALFVPTAFGQAVRPIKCPHFYVHAIYGIPADGEIVPFYVRWGDELADIKPQYKWRVVGAGELVAGQGTMIAEVRVFVGRNFTVTVDIDSLPARCPNSASESGVIDLAPTPIKLDEYNGPLTRIPKVRIETVLKALKQNSGSQIYIILSGRYSDYRKSIANKRKVINRDLLSEFEENPPVTVIEHLSAHDDKLVIWLVPPGSPAPPR